MDVLEAYPGFKFGCDPELFIMNTETGKYVSAEGLIPGTKAEPYKVPKGAVQVDGMAAEFNIDPAESYKEFDHNIKTVLKHLKNMLPEGHELSAVPAVTFDKDVWKKTEDKAKELGCTPDFDAWTGNVNPPPHDPDNPRLRTASGHLHIGWTDDEDTSNLEHLTNCRDLVKQLDWYLGGWSLRVDNDPTRRRLYGKAGACRYKPYGVEYRVLSNFWVMSPSARLAVWNRMQKAIYDMRERFYPTKHSDWSALLIQSINTSTRNPALERKFSFPLQSYNM